ncbi:hypothetical protein [Paenibacillus hamazuiensis]|uniref:hypothetical protein n=1 Tax=Paenibacillus hamazuiensis TaxID=2936508 RepID=UPI00200FC743|nr:hypothetical protein [Paenibacillus hamazuiensis]
MNGRILWIFLLTLLLSACGKEPESRNVPASAELPGNGSAISASGSESKSGNTQTLQEKGEKFAFPMEIPLQFMPVERSELIARAPQPGLEQVKSIPFGSFNGSPVKLDIYKEPGQLQPNGDTIWRGLIDIAGKSYLLPDELSRSHLEPQSEENRSFHLLNRNFPAKDGPYYLLGSLELKAEGPGRGLYILFDRTENKWTSFEEWGAPHITDLDGDGKDEMVVQFPGLHLYPPNVTIYAYGGSRLEKGTVAVESVSAGNRVYAGAAQDTGAIRIGVIGETEPATADYRYENKKLIRLLAGDKK